MSDLFNWFCDYTRKHVKSLPTADVHTSSSKDAVNGTGEGTPSSSPELDSCGSTDGRAEGIASRSPRPSSEGTSQVEGGRNHYRVSHSELTPNSQSIGLKPLSTRGSEAGNCSPAGIHTGEVIDILTRMVIRAEEHAQEESSDTETQRELDSARSQGWR